MANSILIVDEVHQILLEMLDEKAISYKYLPKINLSEAKEITSNYIGIIIRSKFKIDKEFIDLSQKLKIIGRVGAGLENIDLEYCKEKNIKVVNSPEGNRDAVGEHAIGMILSLFNKLKQADLQIREGVWNRETNRGIELAGKTVGIIGYGNMGSAFAKKLLGFDVNVIAYDKYKTNYSDDYVKEVSLNEIFEKTDILSLHTPLTEETKYLINSEFVKKFKKPIYIINTARGQSLNISDLVRDLKNKKVLGACLDVLEYEKLNFENIANNNSSESFTYLLKSDNVILSPHVAGWTDESYVKISKVIAEKFIDFLV